jgi:hypothetical protein
LLASLVRSIDAAEPQAIALDIIFDRRTRADAELIQALRIAKAPVVLGAVDERVRDIDGLVPRESLAIQAEFLKSAGRPYGHLMLERKVGIMAAGDTTVRLIAGPVDQEAVPSARPVTTPGGVRAASPPTAGTTPAAFADVIAHQLGRQLRPGQNLVSWMRAPSDGRSLFATLPLPRHAPEEAKRNPEALIGASERELLKGRVVFIGASMIDRDLHLTPLSVLEGPTAGVTIHAQALAQRLDGNRDITSFPSWVNFILAFIIAMACFAAARAKGVNPRGMAYGIVGLVLIGAASFLAFWLVKIDLPSIALSTAWMAGGFGGFASSWMFRKLRLENGGEE